MHALLHSPAVVPSLAERSITQPDIQYLVHAWNLLWTHAQGHAAVERCQIPDLRGALLCKFKTPVHHLTCGSANLVSRSHASLTTSSSTRLQASHLPRTLITPTSTSLHITTMTSTNYVTPGQQRNLRACMICSFVQTVQVRTIPPFPHPPTPSAATLLTPFPHRSLNPKAAQTAKTSSAVSTTEMQSTRSRRRCLRG